MTSTPLVPSASFPTRRSLREQERRTAKISPRTVTPAEVVPAASATPASKVGWARIIATRFFSGAVLLAIPALVVGSSIPAQAFQTSNSGTLIDSSWTTGAQSLVVSGTSAQISTARDSYAVTQLTRLLTSTHAVAAQSNGSSISAEPTSSGVARIGAPGPVIWPTDVSPIAGHGVSNGHHGQDLIMAGGTPVHALADGTVLVSSTQGSYGQYVVVQYNIGGHVIQSLYAHMRYGSSPVSPGQTVHQGDVVGLVGSTGAATTNLLYLRIIQDGQLCDTITWIAGNAVGGAAPH